jgi:Uma2 family endonuclease
MSVGSLPQIPGYWALAGFRRLTVDEFHRLINIGFLGEKDPIHLLEGNMVYKMPPNPPHSNTTTRTTRTLIRLLPDVWQLRSEQPITLSDSEPQPDIVLARGDHTTYRTRHPGPADIGLVVEVADTSLTVDRNVVDRQVEVYTDPRPADPVPAYATRTDYRPGDAVPLVLGGRPIAQLPVDDLLG